MASAVTGLLTLETLRGLAGPRSFERGQDYAEIGAVGSLQWDEMSVRAGVQGSERYRVRLEVSGEKLVGSCSCPVGREGLFCKHCVAVGLIGLAASLGEDGAVAPTSSELRCRLAALGADALADLLVEHALDDERLHARLLARTAGQGPGAGLDLRRLAHAFDVAVDPGGFISWNEAYGFAEGLREVIDEAQKQFAGGDPAAIVGFCEHALRAVEHAFGYVDDSNGGLGEIKERLEELHLTACREARPDPSELAERLFSWELESDWEVFYGAVERYADVLGARGLALYRELTEAAWEHEPELGPKDEGRGWDSRRFRLSGMMENIARAAGDVDALVAVLARDRSSAYRYLTIAEALLAAGRIAEATDWAERGVVAFPERTDGRLLDFLCDRYADGSRHEDALRLAWTALEESRSLGAYQRAARIARRADAWGEWRNRALDLLRHRSRGTAHGDRSEIVAALLWENDDDAAWHEATEGGCRTELWLALARCRERDCPADALDVYLTQIEPAIRHSDNHTYTGATDWLEKVRPIFARLNRKDEFEELVEELRARHRAKRNLMKRLDERGWGLPTTDGHAEVHSPKTPYTRNREGHLR